VILIAAVLWFRKSAAVILAAAFLVVASMAWANITKP
jgi:hypothetical protein